MRPIIIEGPDATGKSTLGRYLATAFHYELKESEGPTRSPQDLDDRLDRYDKLLEEHRGRVIFVRHPLISEPIYGTYLRHQPNISFEQAELRIRSLNPVLIYCDIPPVPVDHQLKLFDTDQFVDSLKQAAPLICQEYYDWVYVGLGARYYVINGISMEGIRWQIEQSIGQ